MKEGTDTRVAAYCRVSTDREDQLHSFESQKSYFREYIGRQAGWLLTEIYADEGITGTSTRKRDGFNRLVADARSGLFQLVLTKEVSRFSRNILDAIAYTRLLKSLGVGVVFLSDGISTLEPDAELRLSIMASVAQEESRKTSERVKWGQRRQMERGVVFGRSLLGYDVCGGRLTVEPKGASVVRLIFHMFAGERLGTRAIAERLTSAGVETMAGKTAWSPASVLKIVKNEKYCGDLLQKKTVTPDYLTHRKCVNKDQSDQILLKDHHEPIVGRELWEEAQAERRRRARAIPAAGHGSRYALSGRIGCAECGSVFVCRTRKRRDGQPYRVWQSTCRHGVRQLREDRIAGCVREFAATNREQLPPEVLTVPAAKEAPENFLSASLEKLREIGQKNIRLADRYISGALPREDYFALRDRYKKQAADLAVRLSDAARPIEKQTAGRDDDCYLMLIGRIDVHDGGRLDIYLLNMTKCITLTV